MPGTFLITNAHLFTLSLIYNSSITKFCGMCFLLMKNVELDLQIGRDNGLLLRRTAQLKHEREDRTH